MILKFPVSICLLIFFKTEIECDSEWAKKLPVDMRTNLMQLMNIELIVSSSLKSHRLKVG